jgi:pullulanase/glycogen debranching enzyme
LGQFVASLIQLRKNHPVFHRWKPMAAPGAENHPIVACYRPDGTQIAQTDWPAGSAGPILICLEGNLNQVDHRGAPIVDNDFCILLNPAAEDVSFTLSGTVGGQWKTVVHTAAVDLVGWPCRAGEAVAVPAHSLVVLCREQ